MTPLKLDPLLRRNLYFAQMLRFLATVVAIMIGLSGVQAGESVIRLVEFDDVAVTGLGVDEALALHEKQEALCIDLGDKDGLRRSLGNQALIRQEGGHLKQAMALHKKEEALCIELGNQDGLQRSLGNQALILKDWGRLEEALELHMREEALCVELGNTDGIYISLGNQALILKAWGRQAEAEALLKKQRNGPTGDIKLTFLTTYTRFENLAEDQYIKE